MKAENLPAHQQAPADVKNPSGGEVGRVCADAIYHGDGIAGMERMGAKTVDLIITDPPFAIDFTARRANYNRKAGRVLEGYSDIAAKDYPAFSRAWLMQAYRVLAPGGGAFVFSGWNNLKDILNAADDAGFVTVNHIVWKYQFGVACKRRFVTSHYHCLYLCRDDARRKFYPDARYKTGERAANGGSLRYRDLEDVWIIKREYWNGDIKTPTKLPRELIEKILAYTSDEGDLVLDPFLGSGQVAVVAKLNKRRYIGFEIVREYYEFAKQRLEEKKYRIKEEDSYTARNFSLYRN
jgi:site-specific DNA-methyltransferase (adenine-specific)